MLGYEVEFGHMHVVGLISAPRYAEKQVGYTVASVLLNEHHEFLRLVINSVREDIISRSEIFQCLGLSFVANVGGNEFADALAADVQRVLLNGGARPIVRKKAALALLRLFRRNKEILDPNTFSRQLADLLDERDLGILSGVMSLLTGILAHDHRGYEVCIPKVCAVLTRLAKNKDIPADYQYYLLPSPWLQVKCLRALQYIPTPEDPEYLKAEIDVITQVFNSTTTVRNVNKNNALHAVLFEAVSLAAQLDLGNDTSLIEQSITALGAFITKSEPNIAYLGLNHLTNLVAPDTLDAIKAYIPEVIPRLHDVDISIRKRALDLLFAACDSTNAREIVGHLLRYLTTADFAIREELALKTAILAERNIQSDGGKAWFLDTCLTLIDKAGDFVSDKMWHRVVQVVTNAPELHQVASRKCLERLKQGSPHEMFTRVGAYCLGEFGHTMNGTESPTEYSALLLNLFKTANIDTRRVILTALAKIAMHAGADDGLRANLGTLFRQYAVSEQVEIQQRSVEYYVMTNVSGNVARLSSVMQPMPNFPDRQSALEGEVTTAGGGAADAVAVRKARTGGTVRVAPPPIQPSPKNENGTGHDSVGENVPTMGLADLLGGGASNAPAPAPTSGGLEDLLGVGVRAPAAAPAVGSNPNTLVDQMASLGGQSNGYAVGEQASVGGALVDDLGLGLGGAAPNVSAAPAPSGLVDQMNAPAVNGHQTPSQPQGSFIPPSVDINECLKKLRVNDNGLLYEDPFVQIGVKSQWQMNQGRVMLYLGNKHASELQNFSLVLSNGSGSSGLAARLARVPTNLGPKKQVQVLLELAAQGAYAHSPTLQLQYTATDANQSMQCKISMETPYTPHKFLQPWVSDDPNVFFAKWQELITKAHEVSVVRVNSVIASSGVDGISRALLDCKLTPKPGLDPNPKNCVAGGIMPYTSTPNTTVMVRVEADANDLHQFRVTVAGDDRETVVAVQKAVVEAMQ